jgi:hypothetical protein
MKTEEKIFTIFLLAIIAAMIFFTFDIQRSGSKLVPFIVGLCTLLLLILLAAMALWSRFASWYRRLEGRTAPMLSGAMPAAAESKDEIQPLKTRKKEITVVGWLLFLTAATYFLGFLIAIPLFLFLFLKVWAKEGWGVSLAMPVAVSAVVYFIFVYILQIPLHTGAFFDF